LAGKKNKKKKLSISKNFPPTHTGQEKAERARLAAAERASAKAASASAKAASASAKPTSASGKPESAARRPRSDKGGKATATRAWTEEEQAIFLRGLETVGRDWAAISNMLGGSREKSAVSVACDSLGRRLIVFGWIAVKKKIIIIKKCT
jgi:hypothetical protein